MEKLPALSCNTCGLGEVWVDPARKDLGTLPNGDIPEFFRRKNKIEAENKTGCTYDLLKEDQLHYRILGDVTGLRKAQYGVAIDEKTGALMEIDDKNVGSYVTSARSNHEIKPIGLKELNAFGVELGNVWLLTQDIYDPEHPNWGRSIRGGSWKYNVDSAESHVRLNVQVDAPIDDVGFAWSRTCPVAP